MTDTDMNIKSYFAASPVLVPNNKQISPSLVPALSAKLASANKLLAPLAVDTQSPNKNDDESDKQSNLLNNLGKFGTFIPTAMIAQIMSLVFPSAELVLSHSPKDNAHSVWKIQVCDLLAAPFESNTSNKSIAIIPWCKNRATDLARCKDIASYVYRYRVSTVNTTLDTMIYLAYNNLTNAFEVYDGMHRLTALRMIYRENTSGLTGEFGSNGDAHWLYDTYMLVSIKFNAVAEDVSHAFRDLNLAVPVTKECKIEAGETRNNTVDVVFHRWRVRYSKHFTTSQRPGCGNITEAMLVELLNKVYRECKVSEAVDEVEQLEALLQRKNAQIKHAFETNTGTAVKIPSAARERCIESGCYLFLRHKFPAIEPDNFNV